jgi:hypothetical protein
MIGVSRRVMIRTAGRASLGLIAAAQAEIGFWGLIAPHGFYTGFPGAGHHWVSAIGPYDEHLVRDFAALSLGFAVLMAGAAIWFERRLVLVAGSAFIAGTLPHFAYHLTTTDHLSAADNAASLGSFALELGLAVLAMWAVTTPERTPDATLVGASTAR